MAIDREVPGIPSVRWIIAAVASKYAISHRARPSPHRAAHRPRRVAAEFGTPRRLPAGAAEAKLKVDPDLIRPQTQGSSIAFSDVCQLLKAPTVRPRSYPRHAHAGRRDGCACQQRPALSRRHVTGVHRRHRSRAACTPGISALTWDLDQMGRVAANILLDRIRGGDDAARSGRSTCGTRFILRHSGAKPRAP